MLARIKEASLINPIMHRGSMATTLNCGNGDVMEADGAFVKMTPNPSTGKDAFHIPMSNIKRLVFVDEEAEARRAENTKKSEAEKAEVVKKAQVAKRLALKGIEKFVKNPTTGQIETVIT